VAWRILNRPRYRAPVFWGVAAAVYGAGATVLLALMWHARGDLPGGLVYRIALVPLLLYLFLYVLGWPIVQWSFGSRKRRFADVTLAPLFGMMLASLSHSLSLAGVRPWCCLGLLLAYALAAWAWHVAHRRYPVLPDMAGTLAVAAALVLFWIGMAPVRHQRDVTCFTTNCGDWYVYVMETQWQMEHTLAEAQLLAQNRQEPVYMSYFAYATTELQHIGKYYSGAQSAMAMGALLTGISACQIYAYASAMLLALIPLAGTGALLACLLIRRQTVWAAVLFLAANHLPLLLQRDGFIGQLFTLPLLLPITAFGAFAFVTRRWRLALPVGIGLASIMSAYLVYMPVIALPLGLSAAGAGLAALWRRRYANVMQIVGIAAVMALVAFAGAPQKTTELICEVVDTSSSMHTMRATRAGGANYPMTSPLYLSGVIDNWRLGRATLHIPPVLFNTCSYALMAAGIVCVCFWLVRYRRTWKALYVGSGSILVGAILAWSYWCVPNRYVFFKSMGYVLPLFVAAVFISWDSLLAAARRRSVRGILLTFALLWIGWHVLSVVVTQMPHRFVDQSITSLAAIDRCVPTNAVVRVNFGDMFLTPYTFMAMRHRPLATEQPSGYTPRSYPRADWSYSLENTALPGKLPVWSNAVYYLYRRADL